MKRYWIVARQEIKMQLMRKSFIVFAFIFPLLMMGANVGIGFLTVQRAEQTGTLGDIGYVDRTGLLDNAVEKPAEFLAFPNKEAAKTALSNNSIGAYFVLPSEFLATGTVNAYTNSAIPAGIERQFEQFVRANLLVGFPPEMATRLQDPMHVTMKTLDGARELSEESMLALIFTPIVFAMVFGMSITLTSSYLMQNVAEEKSSRMVELMITSISPLELLWGKILGLGILGLLQIFVWSIAGGAIFLFSRTAAETLTSTDLPVWIIGIGILYLFLGYLLYGSLLAGLGACSASTQEAQSISGLFSLVAISPLFALMAFFKGSSQWLPLLLSLFPFTSPTAMMMRISLGQVPAWQIASSIAILAITSAFVVWIAAWTFRTGLLMVGKRLTPKNLIVAIKRGKDTMTRPIKGQSNADTALRSR